MSESAPAAPDAVRADVVPVAASRRSRARAGLTADDVLRYAASCLPTCPGSRTVGIETEWLVVDRAASDRSVPPESTRAALAALIGRPAKASRQDPTARAASASGTVGGDASATEPTGAALAEGSRITFEPGGQLELSGPPAPLPLAVSRLADDLADVRAALADAGLGLAGMGLDPVRPPVRWLADRYAAMAGYWTANGQEAGEVMMCSSASVQVNLDAGHDSLDVARRWRLAHQLRPVLTAMFAASPARLGALTGLRSARAQVWESLDPTRTRPVGPAQVAAADVACHWAEYLLAARLMMVRDSPPDGPGPGDPDETGPRGALPHDANGHGDARLVSVRDGSTFGDWLRGAGPIGRPPMLDDLVLHATTVFPPVRPRGWLEIRYLDAQPFDLWMVPVAVTAALLDDPVAAAGAASACCDADEGWLTASVHGLADDTLRTAALTCMDLALDALGRLGAGSDLCAAVARFRDDYPARGRTPADHLAERFTQVGPAGLLREETR
ncbi:MULTISPECIES: ergothioneine biosynthesis glutamate--cysteine ligase EgtA [unclassified Pseudofrankia]|uniref:ergothioneine biosynthesis glutamate--cysteine ligase EgtA n=1 Tax=unclassified Pseudofrankia TaxID=2994372 RepID=UPI0009F55384|nr:MULTISPECIES: ergothioneine biosynthesis glutamate--cysteine ligase EgtA [unclassified Pseudofrankia]MDT3446622.1 ergothioneine biosynthesis glutamate--cysteine ligase EgtA [Pseudofrankia sp. BMG5.37]